VKVKQAGAKPRARKTYVASREAAAGTAGQVR
jgi:hypothetical protein